MTLDVGVSHPLLDPTNVRLGDNLGPKGVAQVIEPATVAGRLASKQRRTDGVARRHRHRSRTRQRSPLRASGGFSTSLAGLNGRPQTLIARL